MSQTQIRVPVQEIDQVTDIENQIEIQEIKPEIREEEEDNFTCGICYCDCGQEQLKKIGECDHKFCTECFTGFYESLIVNQNKHHKLSCPEYGCDTQPTIQEIKEIISGQNFEKYQKFQENTRVALDKNLIYCSTADCGTILELKFSFKKKLDCSNCQKQTCSECKTPYHGNNSCSKASQNEYENWAVGLNIHKCPKCGCQVEKDGGCPHMRCSICDYSWCWICGFNEKSIFHRLTFGGQGCETLNGMFQSKDRAIKKYGAKGNMLVLMIALLLLLLYLLLPFLAYIGTCIAVPCYLISEQYRRKKYRYRNKRWLLIPQCIFIWILGTLLCILIATLAITLLIVPFYLLFVIVILAVFYNWCLKSKRVQHSQSQKDLVKQKTEKIKFKTKQDQDFLQIQKVKDLRQNQQEVDKRNKRRNLYRIINDKEQRLYKDSQNPADTNDRKIYIDRSTDYGSIEFDQIQDLPESKNRRNSWTGRGNESFEIKVVRQSQKQKLQWGPF